jgi:hypothetical protein
MKQNFFNPESLRLRAAKHLGIQTAAQNVDAMDTQLDTIDFIGFKVSANYCP